MPTLNRYEDLEAYLRGFISFAGGPEYDFVQTFHLLLALLDNLRAHALEGELEDVREMLSDEQAAFILKLAEHVRSPGDARGQGG